MDFQFLAYISLLLVPVFIIIMSLLPFRNVVYDRKHGLKHTFTDSSITTEWDFSSPLTHLKLLKLFILCENNPEKRNKHIRQYARLKESLKEKFDLSDFPDYHQK